MLAGLVISNWCVIASIVVTVWCVYDTAGRSWVKMKKYQRSMREAESRGGRMHYKRSGSRNRNWRQRYTRHISFFSPPSILSVTVLLLFRRALLDCRTLMSRYFRFVRYWLKLDFYVECIVLLYSRDCLFASFWLLKNISTIWFVLHRNKVNWFILVILYVDRITRKKLNE